LQTPPLKIRFGWVRIRVAGVQKLSGM